MRWDEKQSRLSLRKKCENCHQKSIEHDVRFRTIYTHCEGRADSNAGFIMPYHFCMKLTSCTAIGIHRSSPTVRLNSYIRSVKEAASFCIKRTDAIIVKGQRSGSLPNQSTRWQLGRDYWTRPKIRKKITT